MKKLITLLAVFSISFAAIANDDDDRILFIQDRMEAGSERSSFWQRGSTVMFVFGVFSGISTYRNTIAEKSSTFAARKYDGKISGIKATLALANQLKRPLKTHHYAKRLAQIPSETQEQKVKKLAVAERMLQLSAQREAQIKSRKSHISGIVVNLLAAYAIAESDSRQGRGGDPTPNRSNYDDAINHFLAGVAVSEFKIWSAPDDATRAWNMYRSGNYYMDNDEESFTSKVKSSVNLYATLNGIGINYRF